MASKTISLSTDAYERLKRHRRRPGESFTQVVMRAKWDEDTVTAADLLDAWGRRPPVFSLEELDQIEQAKAAELPAEDKWTKI
jgi:hypothetical protein